MTVCAAATTGTTATITATTGTVTATVIADGYKVELSERVRVLITSALDTVATTTTIITITIICSFTYAASVCTYSNQQIQDIHTQHE